MNILFGLWVSLQLLLATEVQKYKPVETTIAPGERIVIKGFRGDVTITASEGEVLEVQGMKPKNGGAFDQWQFKMVKNPGVVEIAVEGGADIADWDKIRAGLVPEYSIVIRAPSRPLEIAWKDGNISLTGWQAEAIINATKGSISCDQCKGSFFAQMINGSIKINGHEGAVNLQTHHGDVTVAKSKGPILIDNHSANYNLVDHHGSIAVTNYQGGFVLSEVNGQLTFTNVQGNITGTKYKGSVKGDTQKGVVSIKALEMQDFVVNSDSAKVTLDLPDESGAIVSIRSENGRMFAMPHFVKRRRGRWTELLGKFKGKEPGQVKIVSKYGDIIVK